MAKSVHREIWPLEVDFGEMLALGNRNRTVTKNQNSGVRLILIYNGCSINVGSCMLTSVRRANVWY